jgi:hypothetical protein
MARKSCLKCGSENILKIPSSTMCINDRNGCYLSTNIKVPKKIMQVHKSINAICQECCFEFKANWVN